MAGDWIKMRADLLTHPKVVRMSSALKADRLRTVGGLFAVWCLFDVHSVDGRLEGYTDEVLDTLVGFPGFAGAMRDVGWLQFEDDSLVTPRFDEHNGQSAKRRAQDSERKREVRKVSAPQADKDRTREEKRREESSVPIGTGVPPTDAERVWAFGVPLLLAAGVKEASARSMLGGLCKAHNAAIVADAIQRCAETGAVDPVSWLQAALKPGAKQNAQETLEAANRAVAQRFLAKDAHANQ